MFRRHVVVGHAQAGAGVQHSAQRVGPGVQLEGAGGHTFGPRWESDEDQHDLDLRANSLALCSAPGPVKVVTVVTFGVYVLLSSPIISGNCVTSTSHRS